jgi:manganese efflux pump family protein
VVVTEIFITLAIAIGLAMDSFAVSLGVGASGKARDSRSKLRLIYHLAFFQGSLIVLGWLAGNTFAGLIGGVDHWIALVLLGYVGIKMIIEGLNPAREGYERVDPTRGKTLIMLSVATSIDAMAVGLSMAMLGDPVLLPALTIGGVTFLFSTLGLLAGARLATSFGKKMEILGGLILISIGLRILITHIFV